MQRIVLWRTSPKLFHAVRAGRVKASWTKNEGLSHARLSTFERAAKLTLEEAAGAPRFRKYRERGGSEGYSREEVVPGVEAA
jgi:hypothetical protein